MQWVCLFLGTNKIETRFKFTHFNNQTFLKSLWLMYIVQLLLKYNCHKQKDSTIYEIPVGPITISFLLARLVIF